MSQEINEGVAYLRALKGSGSTEATAAAPARETNADAQFTPPATVASIDKPCFQGTEKRRSTRYKCEGSVELRENSCDVRTWATFTDVSLQGCYVEAQATYPVGTVLQLKLEAAGFRVETGGNVRVTYPYLGMGIAFIDMSEENRTRLREMLGAISRPTVIMGPGIASTLPSRGPLEAVPVISDPGSAIRAMIDFFENRQLLMRDDFLRLLRKSQETVSR